MTGRTISDAHEPDRPERPEEEREHGERALTGPPDDEEGEEAHHEERVDRPLPVRALHVPDRLEGDDRCARDVGVDRPQVPDEALGALAIPDVDLGLDLDQEPPALPDEPPPELGR